MKRAKSYFFINNRTNSRGKGISLKDNAEPDEALFNDLLDSVVKPKVGSDYQDQADYNAINTKDSTKFTTAENLPEVDTTGSLLTITTTAAVDTSLLRRKKYTVVANIPTVTGDISGRSSSKLVTAANLPKLALDNSDYSAVDAQRPYYDQTITEVTDAGLFSIYKLKMKALTSEMMTHSGFKLSTILDGLRTDVDACVSDVELASAVDTLNTAIGLKATKVTPTFVAGYNGTKVTVNSQGVITQVSKASASDISNDSSVSGSTVKDALNWLKANGGGTGGASDTNGVTNLSDVSGATTTDALNTLLEATQQYMINDFVVKGVGDTIEINKFNSIVVGADVSYTLPTADVSNYGRSISIVNRSNYEVTINGIVNGSTKLSNYNDTLLLVCLFDGVVTYGWWIISDSMLDKVAGNKKELIGDYTAQRGDSIKADAQSVGADINITIPTAGIEGSVIYVYYPTGVPSAYVINLIGGYSATLAQLDWFLLRDNGSYWEAIGTSQNTVDLSAYATLASPTFTGVPLAPTASSGTNTTQIATTAFVTSAISAIPSYTGTSNRITVAAGVIDIASTYVGQTSITTLGTIGTGTWQGTSIADAYISSAATWNAKLSGSLTNNYIPRSNGTNLVDSLLQVDNFAGLYLKRLSTTYGSGLYFEDKSGNLNVGLGRALGQSLIYARLYNTTEVSNLMQLIDTSGVTLFDVRNGYTIIQGRNTFGVTLGIKRSGDTGDNCYFNFFNNRTFAINDSGTDALGDSLCIANFVSSTRGVGLPQIAGNLGTTRNGNIWYDSTANVYKGIVNSVVETFLTVGALVTSSAATLTLSHDVDYVFTGTTTTWTLPAVNASVTGRANAIIIKNRGTGNITLNTNGGSNVLFTTSLVNTLTISVGDSVTLISDGTYFNVI